MVLSSEGLSSAPEMFSNPQPPPTQCQEPLWKAECPSLKDGHIFPQTCDHPGLYGKGGVRVSYRVTLKHYPGLSRWPDIFTGP